MFPMERSAGVCRPDRFRETQRRCNKGKKGWTEVGGGIIQERYHDAEFLVAHQLHQPRDDARFHHDVNAVVVAVGEVGDCPACVGQDVLIGEMEQLDQRRKNLRKGKKNIKHEAALVQEDVQKLQKLRFCLYLLDSRKRRERVLIPAQVGQRPS